LIAPLLHPDFECTATLFGTETRSYGRGPEASALSGWTGRVGGPRIERNARGSPTSETAFLISAASSVAAKGAHGRSRRSMRPSGPSATGRSWASTRTPTAPVPSKPWGWRSRRCRRRTWTQQAA
jgi:hypothetical protein